MIHLILGSMKAGKSKMLLEEYARLSAENPDKSIVFVRSRRDKRDFITRDTSIDTSNIKLVNDREKPIDSDIILVDEAQFIEKPFIDFLLATRDKKTIIAAGLQSDVFGRMWGSISRLMAHSTKLTLLLAHCDVCGKENSALNHIGDGLVGDNYLVLCDECFKNKKGERMQIMENGDIYLSQLMPDPLIRQSFKSYVRGRANVPLKKIGNRVVINAESAHKVLEYAKKHPVLSYEIESPTKISLEILEKTFA
ncbi:hypothetical protein LS74_001555 [Helicobacter magdeburgensis]|uniref:Thymidine kinase n=1 Tax=Helicobacter magdeburgensis TaxID=471858 RepID=A0A4U8T200_9HELI|nr:hypothetical protein [Helicobacter magdeburgensis]TLD93441.1 hypothetical protein LS74_001555 [Helicobacter magdeburgensis]